MARHNGRGPDSFLIRPLILGVHALRVVTQWVTCPQDQMHRNIYMHLFTS